MKNAFTVLELVVVLGVISVLIGLGSYGVIMFRDSIRIDNAYNDLLSYIQSTQNLAINSSAIPFNAGEFDVGIDSPPNVPEYYSLIFSENTFDLFYCFDGSSEVITCTKIETNTLEEYNAKITSNCSALAFRTSTIDILDTNIIDRTNNSATLNADESLEECVITVYDESSGMQKELVINFENNSVNDNIE